MQIKSNFFRNFLFEKAVFTYRIKSMFALTLLLSLLLIINIFYLQIINFKNYFNKSNENYIKVIHTIPDRGIIYDRNGIPIALNRTVYQLELTPSKIKNLKKTIDNLRSIIDLNDNDINNFKKEYKHAAHFISLPIKNNLTEIQQAKFAVNKFKFIGVEVKNYQRRYYPYGAALSHVIGYVSKRKNFNIKKLDNKDAITNYITSYDIGKLGIERYYENFLCGKTGYFKVAINSHGKIIKKLHETLPQSGNNITLTIDLHLQLYIKKLLTGSRSAVIVTDPRDGSILALLSNPSYDPNLFVNGISNKRYQDLLKDNNFPLINRVTQGTYPPASTIKPYIIISALTLGIINKNFLMFDPGWWQLPGSEKRFHDWKRQGHGWLNITKALEESSDTFFYQIAYNMGIDRLSEWMSKFGYGQSTGIDLYEEKIGVIPTRNWKMKNFKKPWYQGDTISVGIGQGYWTATPIQMSKALITLINNGIIYTPHLLKKTQINDQIILFNETKLNKIHDPHISFWEIVKDGMFGVANRSNGTSNKNFADSTYKIAAKSGTAQLFSLKYNEIYNKNKITERLRDHKMMIAFAPYKNPTVAVVVILENGSSYLTAGAITRHILDYMFEKFSK